MAGSARTSATASPSPPQSLEAQETTGQTSVTGRWQEDEAVTQCPLCRAPFTRILRKHHCRQCGSLVCDDCSKQRLRLPRQPLWGRVRVCDPCAGIIGQSHATGFEEDLAGKEEMIQQLRNALSQSYAESEVNKRVLLEFEAAATGDLTLLDEYAKDPESDAHSFAGLQAKVQEHWTQLLASVGQESQKQAELMEHHEELLLRRADLSMQREDLQRRRDELDRALAEVTRAEGMRDELVRREVKLQEEVAAVRRRVHELELERREYEERQARRRGLEISSPGHPGGRPTTISAGRQDPLLANSRLEGCRRSCAIM